MMKIKYVEKKKLYPFFGAVMFKSENIYIRKDLPKSVREFVLEHEKYHLRDYKELKKKNKRESIFWGEIKASVYGFFKHPLGALATFFFWLKRAPKSIYLYLNKKAYVKAVSKLGKNLK